MTTQHYLITNVNTVTLTGCTPDVYGSTNVHLHASAIVLSRDERRSRQEPPCQIRLFGPDAAWPITNLSATTIAHEIVPVVYLIPGVLQNSYDLHVGDRHLKIATESQDGAPPEVTAYPDGTPIGNVWQDLRAKVAKHWSGPNMPTLEWLPADYVRQLRKTVKES